MGTLTRNQDVRRPRLTTSFISGFVAGREEFLYKGSIFTLEMLETDRFSEEFLIVKL